VELAPTWIWVLSAKRITVEAEPGVLTVSPAKTSRLKIRSSPLAAVTRVPVAPLKCRWTTLPICGSANAVEAHRTMAAMPQYTKRSEELRICCS